MDNRYQLKCGKCGATIDFKTTKRHLTFACPKCHGKIDIELSEKYLSKTKLPIDPMLEYNGKPIILTPPKEKIKTPPASQKQAGKTKNTTGRKNSSNDTNGIAYFRINGKGENAIRQYLQMSYPELLTGCTDPKRTAEHVLKQIFIPDIKGKYIVTNNSYMTPTGGIEERLSIRTKSGTSNFLTSRLYEPDREFRVSGELSPNGVFFIDRVDIIRTAPLMFNEQEYSFSVRYVGGSENTCLRKIASDLPMYSQEMQDELTLWSKYLDWKQKLAEVKIRSVKYFGVRIIRSNYNIDGIAFRCAATDAVSFEKFARTIRREKDNIAIYPNSLSKNRWSFTYNTEAKNEREYLLPVMQVNERAPSDAAWRDEDAYLKKTEQMTQQEYRKQIDSLHTVFTEPKYFEVIFDIPSDIREYFEHEALTSDEMIAYIRQNILSKIGHDGFIATSHIGDFALNTRLKRAVMELSEGRATSGNLGNWIFDITKARTCSSAISVSDITWSAWGKDHLNGSQKQAIAAMLSAPDVFLCQGPPGTGKTTVIAEAVYQLTIRNKRVLIASQTNLAVNNALSRLSRYPNIRAIRLGADYKLDDSVADISDQNILKTFFKRVRDGVDQRFISRWDQADRDKQQFQEMQRYNKDLNQALSQKQNAYKAVLDKTESVSKEIACCADRSEKEYEQLQQLKFQALNFKQCADAIDLRTAPEEPPFLNVEQAQELYEKIRNELCLFSEAQYRVLPKHVTAGAGFAGLTRKEINYAVLDLIRFLTFVCKIGPSSENSEIADGCSQELRELKIRFRELSNRPTLTIEQILQRYELEQQIKQLESADNSSVVPTEFLTYLPTELHTKAQSEEGDNVRKTIFAQIGAVAEETLNKISEFLKSSIASIYLQTSGSDEEMKNLRNKQGELETEQLRLEEEIKELKADRADLAKSLRCSSGNIDSCINGKLADIDRKAEGSLPRVDFEPFLREFMFHIDSLGDDYTLENSEYLKHFINACNVVGISCTESSSTLTQNGFNTFDVAIIDEVSKATPPELLIPLLLAEKAILVGDHRQLPPLFGEHWTSYQDYVQDIDDTDEDAKKLLSDDNFKRFEELVTNSLFKRHYEQAAPANKRSLLKQYRMHREIMDVVNMFYDGKLESGLTEKEEDAAKSHMVNVRSHQGNAALITKDHHAYWLDSSSLYGRPYYESSNGTSMQNELEATMIAKVLQQIDDSYADQETESPVEVGVISFYAAQVGLIKRKIGKWCNLQHISLEVNTVDRFQGKEKAIVLVSLVRNVPPRKNYDATYVKAFQRINVAMSRAQNLLLIIGAKDMYANQEIPIEDMDTGRLTESKFVYRDIIELLNMRGCFITADDIVSRDTANEILTSR